MKRKSGLGWRMLALMGLVVALGVGCRPRAEEVETEEPEPTATDTEEPTDAPEPTETDTPEPTETDTPEPTETDTPEPTETNTLAPSSGGGSGSGSGGGGGSQATNPPAPSATTGAGQPTSTAAPPTFTPVPPTATTAPSSSDLGTLYLRSQTVNSATCRISVWGNGYELQLDAPATVPLPAGIYGWQAFMGFGQTSPAEMSLPPGGVCSFTCYDEYIEWFCG